MTSDEKPNGGFHTPSAEMQNVLQEADAIVTGERQEAYGPPVESWREVARLWSEVLGHKVTASDALRCMIAMKLSREKFKHKRDNLTDIAGYTLILEMVEAQNKKERYEQVLRDTSNAVHSEGS